MVDLGTGDGRYVLHTARQEPETLVVGVDANAASMVEASRKASRGDLPNALFVVASVEDLPRELDGRADDVRIHFPWGSLLRGIASADEAIMQPIARLCAPGGMISALVSITERDAGVNACMPEDLTSLAPAYARHGLRLLEARPAERGEIAGARSTWAKRLRAGTHRPVTLLRLVRSDPGPASAGAC